LAINTLDILELGSLGLFTTSSVMIGASIGLYVPISNRLLASTLAFASGSLISALAIELGFEDAIDLIRRGVSAHLAWLSIAGGFITGATIYYVASILLEQKGAALRYPSRFLEFALERKRNAASENLELLSKCELLRHLTPDDIEPLLEHVQRRSIPAGETVFKAGDPGDALYIIASGAVEVINHDDNKIADLGAGQAFGEMALLSGGTRTATIRAKSDCQLLLIKKADFDKILVDDPVLAEQVQKLSRERALSNLGSDDVDPMLWLRTVRESMGHLSRGEERSLIQQTKDSKGAGLAIVLGNILDTIPGCLVIGANFVSLKTLPATLILGMFIGGIPEAAASATMLRKAGYSNRAIFWLWSSVLAAGVIAAICGKIYISGSESMIATLAQAVAGGAILALVTHAMIPEAIHKGGSGIVLPAVGGFLFGLYLALLQTPLV
jgi:zinc transporter ZupT